jgi:hypothetical protein
MYMNIDDSIGSARGGVALVGEILKAAGDNPNVKQSAQNLGQTALTITKTINNALLPLAAVNFAFDKARTYFSEKFQQDIAAKTTAIPLEQIVEPKASIAGPALQGLAFTHEEPSLKEMYLNLLATAMDGRVAAEAHPAFVEIIRQLSAADANLIKGALQSTTPIPIVEVRLGAVDKQGFTTIAKHLLNLTNNVTKVAIEDPQLVVLVDNWIRLGLVTVDYGTHLTGVDAYEWVQKRPEILRFRQTLETESQKLQISNGILIRTAFGAQFARAICLA